MAVVVGLAPSPLPYGRWLGRFGLSGAFCVGPVVGFGLRRGRYTCQQELNPQPVPPFIISLMPAYHRSAERVKWELPH